RLSGFAQMRVLEVALFPTGATHQHRPRPQRVVLGERRRALRRFVVGMGVHGEEGQAVHVASQATWWSAGEPRRLTRRTPGVDSVTWDVDAPAAPSRSPGGTGHPRVL